MRGANRTDPTKSQTKAPADWPAGQTPASSGTPGKETPPNRLFIQSAKRGIPVDIEPRSGLYLFDRHATMLHVWQRIIRQSFKHDTRNDVVYQRGGVLLIPEQERQQGSACSRHRYRYDRPGAQVL